MLPPSMFDPCRLSSPQSAPHQLASSAPRHQHGTVIAVMILRLVFRACTGLVHVGVSMYWNDSFLSCPITQTPPFTRDPSAASGQSPTTPSDGRHDRDGHHCCDDCHHHGDAHGARATGSGGARETENGGAKASPRGSGPGSSPSSACAQRLRPSLQTHAAFMPTVVGHAAEPLLPSAS